MISQVIESTPIHNWLSCEYFDFTQCFKGSNVNLQLSCSFLRSFSQYRHVIILRLIPRVCHGFYNHVAKLVNVQEGARCKISTNDAAFTVLIQGEVVLGVAEFLWSTRDEDVVLAKEILKAGDLRSQGSVDQLIWHHEGITTGFLQKWSQRNQANGFRDIAAWHKGEHAGRK